MRLLQIALAMTVPTRVLKVVAAFVATPGEPADPAITGCPDTWLPPWWISVNRLGDEHPRRQEVR